MKEYNEILRRYYRGETTLAEERQLKAVWAQGKLPGEPLLSLGGRPGALPPELESRISRSLEGKRKNNVRYWVYAAGSVAAVLLLTFSLNHLLRQPENPGLQLSDNAKKERFEDALRIIGQVLEEKNSPEKILYEDNQLIIAIEN